MKRIGDIYSVSVLQLVASDISLATSFSISQQNSLRAHSAVPRFQTESAVQGFDLVTALWAAAFPLWKRIDFNRSFHVGAKLLCPDVFLFSIIL